MGNDVPVNQGLVPALEITVAILGILAFAAWVPVVRGLSQAQNRLRPPGTVNIRQSLSPDPPMSWMG
jgi:hypothetical protein